MRRKDRYIGRLYSDFGKVPSDSGIFRSAGELREFAGGLKGPTWALVEIEGSNGSVGRPSKAQTKLV